MDSSGFTTMLDPSTVQSAVLLNAPLKILKHLGTRVGQMLFTSVLMAAQFFPLLLLPRTRFSCSNSATLSASPLSFLPSWPSFAALPTSHNLQKSNQKQLHHQTHHRYYRRRCHHPILFFPHNFIFVTFIFLSTFVSIASSDVMNNHSLQLETRRIMDASDSKPHATDEYICGTIDIRNSVSLFTKLRNCTVIEGHLQIVLIDNGTPKDFENLSFPKLREITDYFLMFRIMGLQSLSQLFPNLSIIRGRVLLHNYAFIVYEMLHLQEIGLRSLTNIVRGDIRIEKNPNLCFVDTIDWSRIAHNYLISGNKDQIGCPNCPEKCQIVSARRTDGKSIGDSFNKICWTADICQKTSCDDCERKNRTCSDSGSCCPEQCIGGCRMSLDDQKVYCLVCKNFVYKGVCYDKCPKDTYVYFDRRCVTKDECYELSDPSNEIYYKAFLDKCEAHCPVGFTENKGSRHSCTHCGGNCPKVCHGSIVSNIASAQSLKGCTTINGSLEIYISSGGAEIVKELEENLKDLVEITDYLKIARSYPLITLNFLRNLKYIRGYKLERQAYALLILDNPNLQDLWIKDDTSNDTKSIQVENGRAFFHINPKLCYNKIRDMLKYVNFKNWSEIWEERDVSKHTNGDRVPCEVARLEVDIWGVQAMVIVIVFENFKYKLEDPRTLLGYLIYYREAEHRNISIYDGRDACSTSEWTVVEYDDVEMPEFFNNSTKLSQKNLTHIIPNLKPYTQYALYIKTYTIATETKGAQSEIIYFKTLPATPSQPRNLNVKALQHDEIHIKWDPPSKPNGEITYYYIVLSKTPSVMIHRDYCADNFMNKERDVIPSIFETTTTISPAAMWTKDGHRAKKNNSDDSKQCCTCKNEKLRPSDVEQSINFEDYILNTVYIKKRLNGNNSDSNETERKRRAAVHVFENASDFSNDLSTTESTSTTTEEPGAASKVYEIDVVNKHYVTVGSLYHFTEYTIEVKACQGNASYSRPNEAQCSVTAIASVRTLPKSAADDIDQSSISYSFENKTKDSSYKSVFIKWEAPYYPNGPISLYNIKYHRQIAGESIKSISAPICVTRDQYEKNNGYNLVLSPGNYSVQIRARSTASFGNWSQPIYIFIKEPSSGTVLYVIIIIFLLLVILAIICLSYKLKTSRSKLDYVSVNPEYMSAGLAYDPDPKWEVERDKITLIRELGQGSFGMVYQGDLVQNKEVIPCAVKTVNEGSSIRERYDFLKEADVMKSFTDCHHVVKLLGIVSATQPVYVLMELMARGDLRKYLRDNRPDNEENPHSQPPSLQQLYKIAIEIADGMAYLASKKFVHRDLAARNCLVADDMTVKIGDFGMTRDIYETDYYRKGGKGLLPVRWMSPESLKDGIFTTYSDVWSYGIVLWEMATLASQPYQGLSNEEVLKFVVDGGRMNKPENCPEVLWELMAHAWERKPKARPTFLKIVEMLLEHVDKKPFLYLSFYNRWKTEQYNNAHPEEKTDNADDKDESLIPLKPMSPSDSSDSHSESSAGQLCDEDMNVNFFPLSRPVNIFPDADKQDSERSEAISTGNNDNNTKNDYDIEKNNSSTPNDTKSRSENINLLNNNLSASLANSESLSSSSGSHVNFDTSGNKDKILSYGFDSPKLNQPKETNLNSSNRNLLNGHLFNTSMV